jgi:hypothetical protein
MGSSFQKEIRSLRETPGAAKRSRRVRKLAKNGTPLPKAFWRVLGDDLPQNG